MSASLIIDCSIAMAWCFSDERSPVGDQVQDRLVDEIAIVPAHWFLEVTNVLAMAEKRGRISVSDSALFLQLIQEFAIEIDDEIPARSFDHVLPLCRSQKLTSYDAAYLDLALRRRLPLATLDKQLSRAARALGIEVVEN